MPTPSKFLTEIYLATALSLVTTLIWIGIGFICPLVILTENQCLYIFSSASQVIAAVYGLTVTGYIFLRNQQDRLADRDETLVEIFERIQGHQYRFIIFITALSSLSILASLIAIAMREFYIQELRTVTANIASSLFTLSLFWTVYFIADAMRPGKISSASDDIKGEIASEIHEIKRKAEEPKSGLPTKESDLAVFLSNFNAIERILEGFAADHLDRTTYQTTLFEPTISDRAYERRRGPKIRWTKIRILKAMASEQLIPLDLAEELSSLVQYRNALVHGKDMKVDAAMVDRVKEARAALENQLSQFNKSGDNVDA